MSTQIERTIRIDSNDFSASSLINMLSDKRLTKNEKTEIEALIGFNRFIMEENSLYERLSKKNISLNDSIKLETFVNNFDDISLDKFEEFIKKLKENKRVSKSLEPDKQEQKIGSSDSIELQNEILKLKNEVLELKRKLTSINTLSSNKPENLFEL